MAKLVIGTPCYSGTVSTAHHLSAIQSARVLERNGVEYAFLTVDGCCWLPHARGEIVAVFMEKTSDDDDKLLMIDSDVGWEPDAPLQLMGHDVDLVAASQADKFNGKFMIGTKGKPGKTKVPYHMKTGLMGPVPRIATCFMMMKRKTILRMIEAYPELKVNGERIAVGVQQWFYGFFSMPVVGNRMDGEDHQFCDYWTAIGGEIWVDPWIRLTHGVRREPVASSLAESLDLPRLLAEQAA